MKQRKCIYLKEQSNTRRSLYTFVCNKKKKKSLSFRRFMLFNGYNDGTLFVPNIEAQSKKLSTPFLILASWIFGSTTSFCKINLLAVAMLSKSPKSYGKKAPSKGCQFPGNNCCQNNLCHPNTVKVMNKKERKMCMLYIIDTRR